MSSEPSQSHHEPREPPLVVLPMNHIPKGREICIFSTSARPRPRYTYFETENNLDGVQVFWVKTLVSSRKLPSLGSMNDDDSFFFTLLAQSACRTWKISKLSALNPSRVATNETYSLHCVTSMAQLVSQSRHSKKIRTPHCIDSTFPSMEPHMQTIRTLSPWSKIIAVLIGNHPEYCNIGCSLVQES